MRRQQNRQQQGLEIWTAAVTDEWRCCQSDTLSWDHSARFKHFCKTRTEFALGWGPRGCDNLAGQLHCRATDKTWQMLPSEMQTAFTFHLRCATNQAPAHTNGDQSGTSTYRHRPIRHLHASKPTNQVPARASNNQSEFTSQ